jgi:hypothetical protein
MAVGVSKPGVLFSGTHCGGEVGAAAAAGVSAVAAAAEGGGQPARVVAQSIY